MTWEQECDAVDNAVAWTQRAIYDRPISWKLYCVWFDMYLGKALIND